MRFSDDQKNRFLLNLRQPATIFLLWAVLPARLYLQLSELTGIEEKRRKDIRNADRMVKVFRSNRSLNRIIKA